MPANLFESWEECLDQLRWIRRVGIAHLCTLFSIMSSSTKRICLWSSPRNLSTALMYSFAQRDDTIVYDEPLYAHYLLKSGKQHPGREEVLTQMETNGELIVQNTILGDQPKPVAFYKLMTHFLIDLNLDFLSQVQNILYIRSPKKIVASYSKVIDNPVMEDIGVAKQLWLYQYLKESGLPIFILDSDDLLRDPEACLRQLCEQLGISFMPEMLHWTPGPRPEDGVWAKYWYANVHRSNGFQKPQERKENPLPEHLTNLAEEAEAIYQELKEK